MPLINDKFYLLDDQVHMPMMVSLVPSFQVVVLDIVIILAVPMFCSSIFILTVFL